MIIWSNDYTFFGHMLNCNIRIDVKKKHFRGVHDICFVFIPTSVHFIVSKSKLNEDFIAYFIR
jgi:hypothetical protein